MEIGAAIFFTDYSITPTELAIALEQRGFDSLWVAEHSHIPVTRRFNVPGGELTKQYYDVMDPFVTLSAAAAVTKRLKLGTGVCLVIQRDTIQTAKLVASLDDVGLQADQLLRERSYPIGVIAVPPKVHPHVAANDPTQVRKSLRERREARLPQRIVFVARHEHADAPHPVALLRPGHHRPHRRAPEPRDKFAPSHQPSPAAGSTIYHGLACM